MGKGNGGVYLTSQVERVRPGFRFVFIPGSFTVQTHMATLQCDGTEKWVITHDCDAAHFLNGEREYIRCADEIRAHMARDVISQLPRGKLRKRVKG